MLWTCWHSSTPPSRSSKQPPVCRPSATPPSSASIPLSTSSGFVLSRSRTTARCSLHIASLSGDRCRCWIQVHAFKLDPYTGQCTSLGYQSAQGTSTCYLTLDKKMQNLLLVNYWDSTVGTMPVNPDGSLLPVTHMYKPPRKSEISRSGPSPLSACCLKAPGVAARERAAGHTQRMMPRQRSCVR